MRQLWLTIAFLGIFTAPAFAVDLTINNPEINGLEITVSASLSASTNYYLQGTLRSQSSSKYFCETKNMQNNWVDYVSSPDKEYIVSNFFLTDIKESSWSGKLHLRYKADDPNYFGPGLYDLKIRRYTGNSVSSAGESNTLTVKLSEPLPTITPTASPIPAAPVSTQSPTSTPFPTIEPTSVPSILPTPKLSPPSSATIAGATTIAINLSEFGSSPSASIQPSTSMESSIPSLRLDRLKTVIIISLGLALLLTSFYLGYKKFLDQRDITS